MAPPSPSTSSQPASPDTDPRALECLPRQQLWAQVFARRENWLLGYFRKRVAQPADARDLAQEVYLRLLSTDRRQAGAIADPEAYLFTVAANLVKEEAVLNRKRTLLVDVTEVFPELETSEDGIDERLEREQRERLLAEALQRLPPRHRAVMLMQYRERMSYADIAQRLGVSTHMVKKYVVKALALCRLELEGHR
ncbi:RNA polymerase sigma factor [Lysobacter korlensis]|uniref:RNA polymerase sigma factor n=1 Tax=Lysobacter korlensis TaxID=553636 RepID=A0ABV6RSG9_9GAMM